jgi:DNA-directed RNA polymerase, beta subunit/140 kD subunit
VVSQLVRSPGVYFDKQPDKTSDRDLSSVKVIPSRGAWLEFDIDKRDTVGVRIDRKRRQAVTVLLKAIGWTGEQIREKFGWSELMMTTLEKDHIAGQDEALLDIYRKLRPGEPPTRENAQTLLDNLFFNPKRYDVAKVGRYKFNKKLEVEVPITTGVLTVEDIVATVEYLCRLHAGEDGVRAGRHRPLRQPPAAHRGRADPEPGPGRPVPDGAGRPRADDDSGRRGDHAADPDQHPPRGGGDQGVLRYLPAVPVHGPDQPARGPDPPASPVGPGSGRSVPGAGRLRGRDVHPSHYGRMCPIETPEGPNIGLIGALSTFARVNPFGFIETPYRKVVDGRVTDQIDYLTADEEDRHVIAQANEPLKSDGAFAGDRVLVRRKGGEFEAVARWQWTTWTSRRARWCRWRPP